MMITRLVWLELSKDERLVVLQFAADENAKKWKQQ